MDDPIKEVDDANQAEVEERERELEDSKLDEEPEEEVTINKVFLPDEDQEDGFPQPEENYSPQKEMDKTVKELL